ncbi:phosphoglycerol transferase [Bacillus thuringiensis]|uniref:Phosphoglycerol transferase n=2 Tax=Bacillus thuringiensis TaxID=1428 RepID=A0A9X6TLT7_BACTU|nr:phosphoglycerol transferase [Bacillus thuringiensis]
MWTLFLETMFFLILRYFELEKVKEFLNGKIPLSLLTVILWGLLLYIIYLSKGINNKFRPAIRAHVALFLIAHTITFLYIVIQKNVDISHVNKWIYSHAGQYILSFVFIYIMYVFVYSLFGKMILSVTLTSCSFIILAIVNYFKIRFRGEPLYPSDFTQIAQMQSVITMVMDYFSWNYMLVVIASIALFIFAVMYIRKHTESVQISIRMRMILIGVSMLMLYAYSDYPNTFMKSSFQKWGINFIVWNQNENYAENGFVLGFVSNLDTKVIHKPKGYSKEHMIQLANNIKKEYGGNIEKKEQVEKPNIVFIMSEAFWDPTKLTNVTFSADPLPNLHHYIENFPGGQTVTPTYGGNTANTEFEALTGFSMSLLKPGSIPYQQVIPGKKFLPSIVSELKKEGYYASAIHAFDRSFFKRDDVYKVLGFNNFNAEDTMKHTEVDGRYISDLSMSKEILDELNKRKQPTFIHAVTMQNHFPFTAGKFGENKVKISGLEEDRSKAELETYTEGLRRSDQALQYLIKQMNELDRPTLLVFFGDHLPALGINKSIYKEAGYIQDEKTINERLAMTETALLIYANFDVTNDDLGLVSPIYFSNLIFDYTGLNKSSFYQFLSKLHQEIPVLRDELKVGKDGEEIKHLTDKQKELLQQYKLIQYDLLDGKQYSKDILFSR